VSGRPAAFASTGNRPGLHPVRELRAAVALLTRLPAGTIPDERTGSAAFALVGGVLGLAAGLAPLLLADRAPVVGATLALAVLALATGALHLDGLADSADALAAPDAARAEAARKDPRTGSAGVAAIVLVLGTAAGALAAMAGTTALAAAIVAGAASRAVPAVAAPLLGRHAAAGTPAGFGAWFAARAGWGGAGASIATVGLVVAGATALVPGGGAVPAVAAVAGLVVGLALVAGLRRRFGHLAGDFLGAGIEVAFAASLAAAAVAASGR